VDLLCNMLLKLFLMVLDHVKTFGLAVNVKYTMW
jgi:hypothetical protein